MKFKSLPLLLLLVFLCANFLASCASSPNTASAAVQSYLQAIIDRDEAALVNRTCSAWEADARTEFNSFTAVKLTLENVSCQEKGVSGEFTLVECQGSIIASYGAEDLILELNQRTFQVIQENGEWRVCGYQGP